MNARHIEGATARVCSTALALAVLAVLGGLLAARAEAFVYWGDAGRIGRADLNGSNVNFSFITPVSQTCGMAVDGQHLYWAGWGPPGYIGRANLNGTGADSTFISVADSARGLAVDGAHLYWTNWHWPNVSGTIGRADLDGSNLDQSFIALAAQPIEVAVDGEHLYWTGGGNIGRADLDGSNVDPNFIDTPTGALGLAVNATHIFWTSGGSEGRIGRANLNGTGVDESFITFGVDIPDGWDNPAEVDVDGAHIYWANQVGPESGYPRIGRADLDGTNVDQNFIFAYFPCGVAVDALSTPPPRPMPPPTNDFSFGKVKKNKRNGTAKLTVKVPGPGRLELAKTNGVKADEETAEAAGMETLIVNSRRLARKNLNAEGKAKVNPKVTYTPTSGSPNTKSKQLKLVER
jgi:virginiamycin B lyase